VNKTAYDKALSEDVFAPINQDLENHGLVVLGYGGGEWRNLILNKPIHKLSQLRSVTMRVMGSPIQAQVFDAIGIKATPMAYNEVYNAIKSGVVDGLENEPISLETMKFYEVAPYVIMDKHTVTIRPLLFSKKRLDSFPADVRAAVLKAGAQAAIWEHDYESANGTKALQRMQSKGEIHIIDLTPQQKRTLVNRATPVIEKFAKQWGVLDIYKKIEAINAASS
jgi:TRAP-type C4-dicarboxylate transport system substrate-binding protein